MLHVVQFHAAAEASVVAEQTQQLVGLPGVRTIAVYEAAPDAQSGSAGQDSSPGSAGTGARPPRFLVLIDSEDAQDEAVAGRIHRGLADYAGEVWAVSYRRFRRV
jgi:hypothetical protein